HRAACATERAERSDIEAAEDIVEEPVHLAMQSHEGIRLLAVAARGRLLTATPRNEIAHVHGFPPSVRFSKRRSSAPMRIGVELGLICPYAAFSCSMVFG